MLTDNYIFDAFQAESEGEQFPVDFDVIWEAFGYSRKADALRYILKRSGLKRFNLQGFCHLALSYNQSSENDKIYLSCMSFKFTLARANTKKGEEYLIHLLELEQSYLGSLERALNSEPNLGIKKLELEIAALRAEVGELRKITNTHVADRLEFSYSLKAIHLDSNIVNVTQVKNAILRDFTENKHYQIIGKSIFITEELYTFLMLSFRSEKGANISKLPPILLINRDRFFQFQQLRNSKNARVAQTIERLEENGQMRFPGI